MKGDEIILKEINDVSVLPDQWKEVFCTSINNTVWNVGKLIKNCIIALHDTSMYDNKMFYCCTGEDEEMYEYKVFAIKK